LLIDPIRPSQLIERWLRKEGVDVITGEDGEDLVELMITKGKRFDIVLLDENMRRMNGSAATLLLRKHESANGLPSTPVLVTTGAPSTGRQLYSSILDHPLFTFHPEHRDISH
jgi:CheY-like chemotaxis protein